MFRKIKNWNSLKSINLISIILVTAIVTITLSTNSYAQGDWKNLNPTKSPTANFGLSITLFPIGDLLLLGGQESTQKMYNDLHSYNNGQWKPETLPNNAQHKLEYHCAWYLNGKLYAHAGMNEKQLPLNDLWNYDPINKEWTKIPKTDPSTSARFYHKASVKSDGKATISGEYNCLKILNDIWLYYPITNQW